MFEFLETVILEFIRLIGPAAVAAFATYKMAKSQYEGKLKEIEKNNQFKAAELVFGLYKKWHEDIAEGYQSISGGLMHITGFISGSEISGSDDETFLKLLKVYSNKLPYQLKKTIRDFEPLKDKYPLEIEELRNAKKKFDLIEPLSQNNYMEYALTLESIYATLSQCGQILVGEKMDETLAKYS